MQERRRMSDSNFQAKPRMENERPREPQSACVFQPPPFWANPTHIIAVIKECRALELVAVENIKEALANPRNSKTEEALQW
jgi:hypothetical protein